MEHLRKSERISLFDTEMNDDNFVIKPREKVCTTLDILNCSEIYSFLKGVVTRISPKNIIFDMTNIESIDSSAFGVLISINRLMDKHGLGNIILTNLPLCVIKALEMLDMRDYFQEAQSPDKLSSITSTT